MAANSSLAIDEETSGWNHSRFQGWQQDNPMASAFGDSKIGAECR